jgi:ankyrin repeat protein
LIAPNILVTAGHCIESYEDCQNSAWVFDFDRENKKLSYKRSVFRCSAILQQEYSDNDKKFPNDLAVLLLDRSTHRKITPRRTTGKVPNNAKLAVVGHPSGLPQKIATHGTIRRNDHPIFFVSNLDTFSGNSGSPVIDLKSGLIEGILVRGEDDYEYDSNRHCSVVKRCKMDQCRGEDVTRITNIHYTLQSKDLFSQIRLHKISAYFNLITHADLREIVDPVSGNTPLIEAIVSGNKKVAKYLLRKQVDVSQKNRFNLDAFTALAKIRDKKLNSLIKPLLKNRYFVIDKLEQNRTPLITSAIFGHRELAQALIKQGANINQTNSRGYNALIVALRNNRTEVAQLLFNDTDLEHADRSGWSPLLVAARYNQPILVENILNKVGERTINQQNIFGHTPLMLAILNPYSETFDFILRQSNIDLNIQRRNGQTAAHFALQNNQLDKFFKLVENGARTDIKDKRNLTVIDLLKRMQRLDLVERVNQIIIKRGSNDE